MKNRKRFLEKWRVQEEELPVAVGVVAGPWPRGSAAPLDPGELLALDSAFEKALGYFPGDERAPAEPTARKLKHDVQNDMLSILDLKDVHCRKQEDATVPANVTDAQGYHRTEQQLRPKKIFDLWQFVDRLWTYFHALLHGLLACPSKTRFMLS